MMDMGKTLKQLREERGLTQLSLALQTGYGRASIANMEERRFFFQLEPLIVVTNALGVKLSEFFALAERGAA